MHHQLCYSSINFIKCSALKIGSAPISHKLTVALHTLRTWKNRIFYFLFIRTHMTANKCSRIRTYLTCRDNPCSLITFSICNSYSPLANDSRSYVFLLFVLNFISFYSTFVSVFGYQFI